MKVIKVSIQFLLPGNPLGCFLVSVFLVLLISKSITAQYLQVFDVKTDAFPVLTARFLYTDEQGYAFDKLNKDEITIVENNQQAKLMEVKMPEKTTPVPLSVVLTFDISSSMDEDRLAIARGAGFELLDLLPLFESECAITSFDHSNYLNQDFTHNKSKLTDAISSLTSQGGTNYNSGFALPFAGALNVAREGRHKKIVIFLTDGMGQGDQEEIIRMANQENVTVFPVTVGMEVPDILKNIARETGGTYYSNVTSSSEARNIYREILFTAQNRSFGKITWRSAAGCQKGINALFEISGVEYSTQYTIGSGQVYKIDLTPRFLSYKTGEDSIHSLRLQAVNRDFQVVSLELEKEQPFELNTITTPFLLQEGNTQEVDITMSPKSREQVFTRLTIENDLCPDYYVYLKAGNTSQEGNLLKLKEPNGEEVFVAGTDTLISWEGKLKEDSVTLYFSENNGNSWDSIVRTTGTSFKWKVPLHTGINNLVKITQDESNKGSAALTYMYSLHGKSYNAHNAHFIHDNEWIISLNEDHSMSLWEGGSGRYIQSYDFHEKWVYDARENDEGEYLVSASDDGTAMIFDILSGQEKQMLNVNGWGINKSLFLWQRAKVVTAGDDGAIRIWDVETGKPEYSFRAHRDWVMDLALSPDKRRIASAGDDQLVKIWNLDTYSHEMTILAHRNWVYDVEFSPDGNHLVSAGKDSAVRVWNAQNGKLIKTLTGFQGWVYSVDYSPDGKYLLVASKDGTLQVYETSKYKLLDTRKAPPGVWYRKASFGAQSERVVSADSKGEVQIWAVNTGNDYLKDVSDQTFSIISPLPDISDVYFERHRIGQVYDTLLPAYFRNARDHKIYILDVMITGKDRDAFQVVWPAGDNTLEAGASQRLELQFKPTHRGNHTAGILVSTGLDSLERQLGGIGVITDYRIIDSLHDFGKVRPGKNKSDTLEIVQNTGDRPLRIQNLVLKGAGSSAFRFQLSAEAARLLPDEILKLPVFFQPREGGRVNASLTFSVSGYPGKEQVGLFGEGQHSRTLFLRGNVFSYHDSLPVDALLKCYDLETNRLVKDQKVMPNKGFSMYLNKGRKYRITAEKTGYLPGNIHLDASGYMAEDTLIRNLFIPRIDIGSRITLDNIFFEFNKSNLTSTSRGELNQLVVFMQNHPGLIAEVAGHTDSIGDALYNQSLSRERALSVKKYMIQQGIKESRIKAKGFGEKRPVAENQTREGRQKNRRVEFIILNTKAPGLHD